MPVPLGYEKWKNKPVCYSRIEHYCQTVEAVKNKMYNIGVYANYKSFSFDNGDNENSRNHY